MFLTYFMAITAEVGPANGIASILEKPIDLAHPSKSLAVKSNPSSVSIIIFKETIRPKAFLLLSLSIIFSIII